MRIEFSDHANEQNAIRKIPKIRIIATVKRPEYIIPSFRNRQLRQKTFGNKTLEVVTITEDDVITIITQYYLEGDS